MTKEQLREFEKDLVKTGLENVQNIVLIKNGINDGRFISMDFMSPNTKLIAKSNNSLFFSLILMHI